MNLTKIWHPYYNWEDYKNGMWSTVNGKERKILLKKAFEFTGNAKIYGSFMKKVIVEWPIACEHHLTNTSSNRRAWIGHAACSMALGCPEDITRQAWGYLTTQQQDEANHMAQVAIAEWESNYVRENSQLH